MKRLQVALGHHLFRFCNSLCWVQTLGAGVGAVHDRVAAIQAEWVFQLVETLTCHFIPAIGQPTIGLQQDGRPQKLVAVPPIRRAAGRATGAQDALIQTVKLRAVLWRLQALLARWLWRYRLQPWFDGRILRVKMREVRNKVLYDFHMRQRGDGNFAFAVFNRGRAGEAVLAIDVH